MDQVSDFVATAVKQASKTNGGATFYGATLSQAWVGGVLFEVGTGPGGTGVLDSFVRLAADGTEKGYNTSGRPLPFDEKTNLTDTHDIQLGNIPIFTITKPDNIGGSSSASQVPGAPSFGVRHHFGTCRVRSVGSQLPGSLQKHA